MRALGGMGQRWMSVYECCMSVRERLTRVCVSMSALNQDLVDYRVFRMRALGGMDERWVSVYECCMSVRE